MYGINVFDGKTGELLSNKEGFPTLYNYDFERLIEAHLNSDSAVELYDADNNRRIVKYVGNSIKTDSDGFCSLIKQ
jgi:hypothetical protein